MKKLMVIAALMCAAVSAQADTGTFSYTISNVPQRPGLTGSYYSGTATILAPSDAYSTSITIADGSASGTISGELCDGLSVFTLTITSGDYTYSETANVIASLHIRPFPGNYWEIGQNPEFTGTGSWTGGPSSGDVPEPTSGLLMLIGVAGLALKRKRA